MERLKKKISKIVAKEIGISPKFVKDNSSIQDDLGADSLDVINIMMAIENKFNIEVDEKTLAEFTSVNSIAYRLAPIVN